MPALVKIDVQVAVLVPVVGCHAHAHDPGGCAGLFGHLAKAPAAAARPVVAEQQVAHWRHVLVVDHVDILVAVVVVVQPARHEVAAGSLAAQQGGDVAEGTVAVVAVQLVGLAGAAGCAGALRRAAPVGDVQVQPAVVVVVGPGGGLAGVLVDEARCDCHVAEALAAVVVEQHVLLTAQHQQIGPAVVVVVGPARAAAVVLEERHLVVERRDAERAVAVVAVEGVRPHAVGDVQVQPAVAVVVGPGLAGDLIALRVLGVDAGRLG